MKTWKKEMADNLRLTIDRLRGKAALLTDRYKAVAAENADLEATVAQLRADLIACQKQVETLQSEVDYLRMAATLAPSREDVERTRSVISGLVREIDLCINDLND